MSGLREVIVLVENLACNEFQIQESYVDSEATKAQVESSFQRFTKLRWQCASNNCHAAVEYSSASGAAASTSGAAREAASASLLGGNFLGPSQGAALHLVIAVTLPAVSGVPGARKMGRWASNWVPGMSGAGPRFTASLAKAGTFQGSIEHHFDDVVKLADGVSDGCDWLVLRNTKEVVEVRLRLLPRVSMPTSISGQLDLKEKRIDPADGIMYTVCELKHKYYGVKSGDQVVEYFQANCLLTGISEEREDEEEEQEKEELKSDDALLQRLRSHREVFSSLNKQAAKLDELSEREPMDLQRLQSLPDKARIDLLLAVLCVLCRHRIVALERFSNTDASEGDELLAPLGDADQIVESRSYDKSGYNTQDMQDMQHTLSDIKHMPRVFFKGDRHGEYKTAFDTALREHAECIFKALVPLVGFENERTNDKVARMVHCYLPAGDAPEATVPDLPNAALLCSVVRAAIDGSADSSDWSTEQMWDVGPEHIVTRFLGLVRVLDPELACSVPAAVEGLNGGRLFCPEVCCLVFNAGEMSFVVLYRTGAARQALALLRVENEDDLREAPPAADPSEVPLQALGRGLSAFSTTRDSQGSVADEVADTPQCTIPRTWLVARDFFAMTIGTGKGSFDARSRAVLYDFAAGLGVPPRLAARWENQIGFALFEILEASSVVDKQKASRKKWNRGKVAMAAVGGAVILGVTGGLAAPVLAAGAGVAGTAVATAGTAIGLGQAAVFAGGAIAAFGTALTALGTTGAVVLFGATGAGLTGWKLTKRWGDLEEFEFEPLDRATLRRISAVEIPAGDAKSVKELDGAVEAGNGTVEEDMLVRGAGGAELVVLAGSRLERRECAVQQSSAEDAGNGTEEGPVVRYRFVREVDVQERAVHLTIFVSGWLHNEDDFTQPWAEAARTFFPSSGHLAIRWETKGLKRLNQMFKSLVTQEVATTSASFWLKGVAAGAATAGSYAAMAAAWPITIIAAMSNLDNAWLVCIERARLAGQCLAHVLADRQTVGQRPVTLIAHSMGARLVFYCMLELHRMQEFHAVDDVVLLGTPVSTRPEKWRMVRAVASGRVLNGYLSSDWALAFFYRYLEWGLSVAGLSEVKVPGVENVDLKGLGIKGHSDYPNHIPDILSKMCIGERRLFVC